MEYKDSERKEDLLELASEVGVAIKELPKAISPAANLSDMKRPGIHLIEPTLDDLQDAIETADIHGTETIWVHRR